MKAEEPLLAAVCAFPAGGGSIRDRLEQMEWERHRPLLTADALEAYIREHPEVIEAWASFSADKRTSGGYYLLAPDDAQGWWGRKSWTVGRLLGSGGHEDWAFPGGPKACAEFILRELDFWSRLRR